MLSCIGLGAGHLLGLILAVVAVRRMDRLSGALHGYRLALTAYVTALVGLFWLLFGLPNPVSLRSLHVESGLPLVAVLIGQVEFPVFMILYGLQDRLSFPEREFGYRWLGPSRRRTTADLAAAIAGIVSGAALLVWGLVGRPPREVAVTLPLAGAGMAMVAALTLTGRRGCRAVCLFVLLALALAACVLFVF